MPDYIPYNDSELQLWLAVFAAALEAHKETFGLADEDIASLRSGRGAFGSALADHLTMQAAAQGATANKKNCRDAVVQTVRRLSRQVDNHPAMTNQLRSIMGLNPKSGGRSASSVGGEVPATYLTTAPGMVIVHFGTSPANELTNGKPSWARGCNIYRKKDGEDEFRLVAFEISSPYVDEVGGPPSGYSYIVRYRGRKAQDLGAASPSTWIAAGGQRAA
jgi:hypothetical protein